MTFHIHRVELKEIFSLRRLFLQENNFQIRYNACHERGWSDSYLIDCNGTKVGYAATKGTEHLNDRDAVFEFYLIPSCRNLSSSLFRKLLNVSGVRYIECQSNDLLLASLLYEFSLNIHADAILFGNSTTTLFKKDNVVFRARHENDVVFEHTSEPLGEYVLVWDTEIIASGGFSVHYNMPFADLYMEVKEAYYRQGFGSFLVQELKKECYLNGRVPAARCRLDNTASRATLLKAGLSIAGYMLLGSIKPELVNS